MANMFELSVIDLIRLRKIYKKAPHKFQKASARVLNEFAFQTKTEIPDVINRHMTVRSPGFVKSSTRYTPARPTGINRQKSVAGSIKRDRFSGWEEQQTGKRRVDTRVATLFARGGSEQKHIAPPTRMKPGNEFPNPGDYDGKNRRQRMVVMLNILRRKRYRKPFIMGGGLYKFHRKKPVMLQAFKEPAQPTRVDWMRESRRRMFKGASIDRIWDKQLRHVFKI